MNHVCESNSMEWERKKCVCFCSNRIVIYVTAPLGSVFANWHSCRARAHSFSLSLSIILFSFCRVRLQIWLDFTNSRNRFPAIMLLIRYLQPFNSKLQCWTLTLWLTFSKAYFTLLYFHLRSTRFLVSLIHTRNRMLWCCEMLYSNVGNICITYRYRHFFTACLNICEHCIFMASMTLDIYWRIEMKVMQCGYGECEWVQNRRSHSLTLTYTHTHTTSKPLHLRFVIRVRDADFIFEYKFFTIIECSTLPSFMAHYDSVHVFGCVHEIGIRERNVGKWILTSDIVESFIHFLSASIILLGVSFRQ